MVQGEVIHKGWRDPQVKEALDLCLSCKGCKGECPVNVDVATYKAEFLAHYYQGRLRPRHAYTLGLIFRWARLASHAPSLANAFTQTPLLRKITRWCMGIAQQRLLPAFAPQTFTQWFRQRPPRLQDQPLVLLWPDTFTNYFRPAIAQAAVEVLEAAGFQVSIPAQTLCCGRPLYDQGMLTTARQLLRHVLTTLQPQILAGIPVVGLEPGCVSVFRDELLSLFPQDENAQRLSKQTFFLSEFLLQHAPDYHVPSLHRTALVQGHCHQKALAALEAETTLLRQLGLDFTLPETGCCGMAGSFGFEQAHYALSQQCGERALLPAVRDAAADTLIIANGFSCQEQIAQSTHRQPLHLAQVIQLALHAEKHGEQTPR
jgi:Fe-S oxidoreductase